MSEPEGFTSGNVNRLTERSLFSAWRAVASVTVLAALTGFTASTVTARSLGAEGFGVFAIATNLLAILVVLAGAGYQLAILRFGPKFVVESDTQQFATMVRSARVQTFLLALIAVAATAAALLLFPQLSPLRRIDVMILTMAALPFAMWTMVNTVVNRVYGHLQLAILPDAIMRHLFLILTAVVCYLWNPLANRDPIYFALAVFLSAAASGIVSHEISRRSTPLGMRGVQTVSSSIAWLKTALTFFGINLFFVLRTQIDVFAVAALVSTKEAGIYAITLRLGDLLSALTTTLSFVISPRISNALAQNDKTLFQQDQRAAALIMTIFGLVIGVPMILGAQYWLGVFGPEFRTGVLALVVFTLSAMIRNFIGPYFYILTMTGHQGTITRLTAASTALQLFLLIVLTSPYGAAGAAIARSVPEVLVAVSGWFIVWRRLGFMTGLPALLSTGRRNQV